MGSPEQGESGRSMKRLPVVVVILATALFLLILTTLILVIGLCTQGFASWESRVCQTRECVKAAARITTFMDESVEPCDDFYKYACGGFEKLHVIPPGGATVNPWSSLSALLLVKVKALLESPSKIDHLNAVQQARNYYKSCMNETVLEEVGIQPLKDFISTKGGWALLNDTWSDPAFDLENYIVKVGLDSMPSILSAMIGPSPNKSDENIVHVGQGALSLGNRDYYLKPKKDNRILQMFEQVLTELAVLLGGEEASVKPEIEKMIEFETDLAKLMVPAAERQAAANRLLLTVEEVKQNYVGLDVMKLLTGFFNSLGHKLDGVSYLGVADDAFLRRVGGLLAKTPKRTLSTYVMFRGVASLLEYTDKKTRGILSRIKAVTQGSVNERPRYQVCAEKTNSKFSYVTARFFVDEYFTEGTHDIKDMTNHLKIVFKENLDKLDWLDDESRKEAKQKIDAMRAKLAYPELILDNEALEKDTTVNDLQPDQFLMNTVKLNREEVLFEVLKLNKPVDKNHWQMPPVTVNAFYSPPGNVMLFPLGILQPPFYDLKGLKVLNYAAIGEVMGHEITHGFDNNGRIYDKDGNKREWMTQESIDRFNEKAQCVVEQYSNMSVPEIGMSVNGVLTQGENIADIGAIKQSFQAYKHWVKENGEEKTLPGLELPADKLFFLSYTQMYCHLITPQLMSLLVQKDTHTPMRERVYGTLINSPDFAEVFKCASGSKMNPGRRCSVW